MFCFRAAVVVVVVAIVVVVVVVIPAVTFCGSRQKLFIICTSFGSENCVTGTKLSSSEGIWLLVVNYSLMAISNQFIVVLMDINHELLT